MGDRERALYYVRNRYYSPELGRFISADPMGYVDGPSQYQFGLYNTLSYSDPYGLCLGFTDGPCYELADDVDVWLDGIESKLTSDSSGYTDGSDVWFDDLQIGIEAVWDTSVGVAVDAAKMFGTDLMRAGQSSGTAIGEGAGGFELGLAIVQDAGRVLEIASFGGLASLKATRAIENADELADAVGLGKGLGRHLEPSVVNKEVGNGGFFGWVGDQYRSIRLRQIHRSTVKAVDEAIAQGNRPFLEALGASQDQIDNAMLGVERFRGTLIDMATKSRAESTFGLRNLEMPGNFEYGPDFWNPQTLRAWDMTTPDQWWNHVVKYALDPPPNSGGNIWRSVEPLIH